MDFLGWWAFHGRQDEISDEVKMWGKILLVPKSEKKVAENLNLNVLICVLISLQKITHLLCDPLCKWSYACGTTSKKLRLPREKSSQWHLIILGNVSNEICTSMKQMTRMTTVTTNDYQDDGQCKDDWWRQYTCCASCTAEPGEEEPAEEQRWHFHISDDLGDKKSHDGGDKKMVTGSARLVVTLKTEALSLHSWWQKIFGQQN